MAELVLAQRTQAFSDEEVKELKEAFDLFTSAYARVAVPLLVFDHEKTKEKFLKSKELFEKVVASG